jgi:hypothetical protein
MKKLIAAIAICIALAGCSSGPPLTSGYITGKNFIAAHSDTYYTNVCYSYNSQGQCTYSQSIPNTVNYDDEWDLVLRSDDGKRTGEVSVSKAEFDSRQIGNHYPDLK